MKHRRDDQYARQQLGRQGEYEDRSGDEDRVDLSGGRGADDWRKDTQRGGWGRNGGETRFGGNRHVHGERPSYQDVGYGYGEGMRGGYSYGRGYPNENLANDFSVEGTRNFSRDEQRSHARGYGIESAFENEGGVRVSHRGKGPKGFKRSDDRIKELVSEALADHHDVDASEVEVSVKDGEVTLTGTVESRFMKRLAEDVVEQVSGVVDVHNALRVKKTAEAQPQTGPAKQNGNVQPSRSH